MATRRSANHLFNFQYTKQTQIQPRRSDYTALSLKQNIFLVFFLMSMHLPIAWAIILVDSPFGILYVAIEILQVLPWHRRSAHASCKHCHFQLNYGIFWFKFIVRNSALWCQYATGDEQRVTLTRIDRFRKTHSFKQSNHSYSGPTS